MSEIKAFAAETKTAFFHGSRRLIFGDYGRISAKISHFDLFTFVFLLISCLFSIFLCFLKMSVYFLHKSGRPTIGTVKPFLTPKSLFWAATSGALSLPILQPKISPKN